MDTLHDPPEWPWPAGRHSELADPVLTVRQLSRFENLGRRPPLQVDNAHVCVTRKHTYDTYLPPRRPQLAGKRYVAVYAVDVGVHPVRAGLRFPSDNDALEFGADIELRWQVHDPALFVESGHRDVPNLLLGDLQQRVRPVLRGFPIQESARAEQSLLHELASGIPLGSAAGLSVRWTVRLRRDEANITHQQRLQAIEHTGVESLQAARSGLPADTAQDARARHQDQLQAERTLLYGQQQHELAMRQLQWDHERALLTSRQGAELQESEVAKIEFYQHYLEKNGAAAWALHLAEHPEDSRLVMEHLRQDQLRYLRSQVDVAKEVLGSDRAEAHELEGLQLAMLHTVKALQAEGQIMTMPGETPSPAADSGGRPAPFLPGAPDRTPSRKADIAAEDSPAEARTLPTRTPDAPDIPPLPHGAPPPRWSPPPAFAAERSPGADDGPATGGDGA
ncbi:hypothetical protein [Streptomyces axinellae]|uniref:PE-PGRS family protein n=1 Tax=Streptomyces axinellae TaxID=552788 RepID=A0ABN3QG19_9ACTN